MASCNLHAFWIEDSCNEGGKAAPRKTRFERSVCLTQDEGETLMNALPAILFIFATAAAITALITAVVNI